MALSMSQYSMLAMIGILVTMSVFKAKQYHAEVGQQIEIAERAIEERDILLFNCQSEGTNIARGIFRLTNKIEEITGERDSANKIADTLKDQVIYLEDSVHNLNGDLDEVESEFIELKNQILEEAHITAEQQIKPLLGELKKAQDDLVATQGQLKEVNVKLAAAGVKM